jgi:hypothetical protein
MPHVKNPFRAKFTKLAPADQIKAVKKLQDRFPTLLQIVSELTKVDPVISIRQDGRLSFVTDKHLFF